LLFFLLSLVLSLLLSGAIFAGLYKALQVNWERKNKRPISYLSPVALTIAFLLLSANLAAPRLLDSVSLLSHEYGSEEIRVAAGDLGWNTLSAKGHRFIYNQWKYRLLPGRTYRFTYTPRSRFIIEFTEIADASDTLP
jgi:hypothetical protein